jgi:hypothetical protein
MGTAEPMERDWLAHELLDGHMQYGAHGAKGVTSARFLAEAATAAIFTILGGAQSGPPVSSSAQSLLYLMTYFPSATELIALYRGKLLRACFRRCQASPISAGPAAWRGR